MEKYILGQSDIGEITKKQPEIRLDLSLKDNIFFDKALVHGCVFDKCGCPVENAFIMFVNKEGHEIGHVYSSNSGLYCYQGFELNTEIRIIVKKQGYEIYNSDLICIYSKTIRFNICLNRKMPLNRVVISGHVYDEKENPLNKVCVVLFTDDKCSKTEIISYTRTNEYGQFILSEVLKGKYKLFIDELYYETYENVIEVREAINSIDILLNKKDSITRITGQISDDMGKPITNALVVLYRVLENNKLLPIEFKYCDEYGRYEFTKMEFGKYIIKAI